MGERALSRKKRKRRFVRDGAKLMGKCESGTIRKWYFHKVKTEKLSVDIWSAFLREFYIRVPNKKDKHTIYSHPYKGE